MQESTEKEIDRGVELLKLCLKLQSEKDGIDRPELWVIDQTKTLDAFASDVSRAAVNMSSLRKLFPLMDRLAVIGRELHGAGLIDVDYGDCFSEAAVSYLERHVADVLANSRSEKGN